MVPRNLFLLLLFLVLATAHNTLAAQVIKSISLEVGLIPTYHKDNSPNRIDFFAYEGDKATDLTWISNLSINILTVENIGLNIGFQHHAIEYRNPDYILSYQTGGNQDLITKDYNHSIIAKSRYYEMPIHLLLAKKLAKKLDLNLLVGGSPLVRIKNEYKITNKNNGTGEHYPGNSKNRRIESNFSPQVLFKLDFNITSNLSVTSSTLFKLKELGHFNKFYVGQGIGLKFYVN